MGTSRDVKPSALKKLYYKAALQYHPDKAGASDAATARFQALSLAHSILSDTERRREYDATGNIDDDASIGGGGGGGPCAPDGTSWSTYWRREFPSFDESDIDAFAVRYRTSKEEVEDILNAYTKHKGDMDAVLDSVPCSLETDADRFADIIHQAIMAGTVKTFPSFVRIYGSQAKAGGSSGGGGDNVAKSRAAAARATRATAEATEADEYLKELRASHTKKHGATVGGGEPSLAEMMRRRAEERATGGAGGGGGLIASLEDRYGGGGGGGKAKKATSSKGTTESPKRKKKA